MIGIVLLQTLHGSAVVILQWNLAFKILILSVPVGFLTGVLFGLLEKKIKESDMKIESMDNRSCLRTNILSNMKEGRLRKIEKASK